MKLAINSFPIGHTANDFKAFGPPATKDGDFSNVMIADLGYFSQKMADEKTGVKSQDSAKYYHGAVVQSKLDQSWFFYAEWGRTGAKSVSFQFNSCISKEDAQQVFSAQMHAKNDKRGMWATIAGIKTLTCKPGKDCYLVRPMAVRVTGLPDAKTIFFNDGAKTLTVKTNISNKVIDPRTSQLLHALGAGTINFTRTSMADASIPTQTAIDEARQILDAAMIRASQVGDKVDDQVKDRDLMDMTGLLYKRIPKKKDRNLAPIHWILSSDNIIKWRDDLDAFEGALYSQVTQTSDDPYDGMNIDMDYIEPQTQIGEFLYSWWPKATRNKHSNMGTMEIVNAWTVHQHDGIKPFSEALKSIHGDKVEHHPLHQPKERIDLSAEEQSVFARSNVALLYHASRSVNIIGILRKRLLLRNKLVGVQLNGALNGDSLYWADDIMKSCQYTSLKNARWTKGDGAVPGRHGFMFVADVILGNPFLVDKTGFYLNPPEGYHSIFAKGDHTIIKDTFTTPKLQNNEWMIYNEDQHRMRYLIELKEKENSRDRRFG